MKPDFALILAHEGLTLLHRVKRGWHLVGEVAFDDPGLKRRILQLRGIAEQLAPDAVRSKLILPETQVLYTSIPSPGPDD
jgi:hypothetical protein